MIDDSESAGGSLAGIRSLGVIGVKGGPSATRKSVYQDGGYPTPNQPPRYTSQPPERMAARSVEKDPSRNGSVICAAFTFRVQAILHWFTGFTVHESCM